MSRVLDFPGIFFIVSGKYRLFCTLICLLMVARLQIGTAIIFKESNYTNQGITLINMP